jgi:hypothetical protein
MPEKQSTIDCFSLNKQFPNSTSPADTKRFAMNLLSSFFETEEEQRRGKNNTICTRGLIYIRGAMRKRKFIESD